MNLSEIGLWTRELDAVPTAQAQGVVAELEALGWRTLWLPEATDRDVLTHATLQLAATERMVVATGIARIHAHGAWATALTQLQLTERFPDRFLLGLGVSHPMVVERLFKQSYEKPLEQMEHFLDTMDKVQARSIHAGAAFPPRVLAALAPRMLRLAASKAAGAHTYMAPVAHTAWAREQLGEGPLLVPAIKAVLTGDVRSGLELARSAVQPTSQIPAYRSLLLAHGFSEEDLQQPLSERLVHALVAIGDEDAIERRIGEHLAAGATQVAVEVLPDSTGSLPLEQWRRLAPLVSR